MKDKNQINASRSINPFQGYRAKYVRALIVASGLLSSPAIAQTVDGQSPADFTKTPIVAFLDYAKIIAIPEETRTVVVGNPSVADITVSGKNRAIITAKGFGYTNFVLFDKNGQILSERLIRVAKSDYKQIVIRKGAEQYTYICDPNCEKTIVLGDNPKHMREAGGAIAMRASLARQ